MSELRYHAECPGRICHPEETFERIRPHLRASGITRVADVTGLDRIGIPVTMAVRPNSRSLSVSQGKGTTLLGAKVSGIMEAMELFHAEDTLRPLMVTSYDDLRDSAQVIDISRLPRRSGRHFKPSQRLSWIEGINCVTGKSVFVPFEIIHTDLRIPRYPSSGCFPSNSNGLASGNVPQEAILHGLCELIERDAMTLWELSGRQSGEVITFRKCADVTIEALLDKITFAGCKLFVYEITSDLGIPVFIAQILDGTPETGVALHAAEGSGCHPSRRLACRRAITEAAQSRLTRIVGARDDLRPEHFIPADRSGVSHHASLRLQPKCFSVGANFDSGTLTDDLAWTLDRLKDGGMDQVITIDLSRDEFGVSVIRVIVPGLEGAYFELNYIPGKRALAHRAC